MPTRKMPLENGANGSKAKLGAASRRSVPTPFPVNRCEGTLKIQLALFKSRLELRDRLQFEAHMPRVFSIFLWPPRKALSFVPMSVAWLHLLGQVELLLAFIRMKTVFLLFFL